MLIIFAIVSLPLGYLLDPSTKNPTINQKPPAHHQKKNTASSPFLAAALVFSFKGPRPKLPKEGHGSESAGGLADPGDLREACP